MPSFYFSSSVPRILKHFKLLITGFILGFQYTIILLVLFIIIIFSFFLFLPTWIFLEVSIRLYFPQHTKMKLTFFVNRAYFKIWVKFEMLWKCRYAELDLTHAKNIDNILSRGNRFLVFRNCVIFIETTSLHLRNKQNISEKSNFDFWTKTVDVGYTYDKSRSSQYWFKLILIYPGPADWNST